MNARYALYYVPADASPLGHFGARLFGRWPDGTPETDTFDLPSRKERTARVARYGFHATLKAPFHLADGTTEDGLLDALAHKVGGWRSVPLDGLSVELETGTLSLRHGKTSCREAMAATSAVARQLVEDFEPWRAPLSESARARRRPERLPEHERALLDRYGYPWVLDAFRFHVTLADRHHDDSDPVWLELLSRRYRELVPEPPSLDRIAVCREAGPGEPVLRVAEFTLSDA